MFDTHTPKFFGRRKGRTIRCAKSTLLEKFLPQIRISQQSVISPQMYNIPIKKMYLEIGFGNGEHLAEGLHSLASRRFLGSESFFVLKKGYLNVEFIYYKQGVLYEKICFGSCRNFGNRIDFLWLNEG